MVYQWALKDNYSNKKICNILVAGHTHIPVFNSCPKDKECMYKVIKNDLETGKYMFFNDIFERKPTSGALYMSSDADTMKIPDSLNNKMKKYLGDQIKNNAQNADRFAVSEGEETDPFYFNTGCGFHSKITCIEINEGEIYLKLLWLNENRKLTEKIVETADLEIYKRKMEKYGNMGKKLPGKK